MIEGQVGTKSLCQLPGRVPMAGRDKAVPGVGRGSESGFLFGEGGLEKSALPTGLPWAGIHTWRQGRQRNRPR